MRGTLNPNRQSVNIKKISDLLLTVVFILIVILIMSYFFHKGAEVVAQMVIQDVTPGTL